MSYPTPMDVAESEDREAHLSPSERLANICSALEESLNESPFTREEWERLDAERLELLKANDALAADNAALRKRCKEHEQFRHQHRDCDAMGIENQALRKDAERLDWLERHDGRFYNLDRITSIVGGGFNGLSTLRAAIDAAMGENRE